MHTTDGTSVYRKVAGAEGKSSCVSIKNHVVTMGRDHCHCKCHKKHRKTACERLIANFAPATYTLVSRTLPDGTVLQGPRVTGTLSFSESGRRVLALSIDNGDGTFFAANLQTNYTVSETSFTDQLIALVLQENVPNPNPNPVTYLYDLPEQSATNVRCRDGVLTITGPPYDPVVDIVITEDSFTVRIAAGPGQFVVDRWARID